MIKEDGSAVHAPYKNMRVTLYRPDDDEYVTVEEKIAHSTKYTYIPFDILAAYVDYHRDKLK